MRIPSVLLSIALIGCGTPTPTSTDPTGGDGANRAPTVTVGADQLVRSGDTVELTGSATDEDGTVETLAWTQLEGPPAALTQADGNAELVAPEVTATTLLVFELTATDDDGSSAVDQTTVVVEPTDGTSTQAPLVNAGDLQVVDEETAVVLTGTATDDGTVVSTTWTAIAGPPITISGASSLTAGFTAPTVGEPTNVVVELRATDDDGLTSVDRTTIVVQPVNTAPLADAGADQAVSAGATVGLTGVASDPDGSLAGIAWVQLAGPTVALDDPGSLTPGFVAPSPETAVDLVFELTVTDDEGATASDTVTLSVGPASAGNLPPTVDAGPDQTVDEQTTVVLAGSASDDDGSVVSTTWTQVAGPTVSLDDPGSLAPSFVAPTTPRSELLVFELVAVDEDGGTSTSTTSVRVEPVNAAPSVEAGPDQTASAGLSVVLDGSAADPDGSVAALTWVQLAGSPVVLDDPTAAQPSFVAPALVAASDLVFALTVTDDEGATASDTVTVRVEADPTGLVGPTVDAGPEQTVDELVRVTLAGSASDPDGSVVSTTWSQLAGPPVTLDDPGAVDTGFQAPSVTRPELIVLVLEAVDDDGVRNTATTSIRVEPVNDAPVVDPGGARTVTEGDTITLAGGVSDPDGDIVRTTWSQLDGPTVTLADPTALTTTFTAPTAVEPVTLVFLLEAEDDEGAVASQSVTITVHPPATANRAPTAFAGPDLRAANTSQVTLAGTASDPDGTIAGVHWVQLSGPTVTFDDDGRLDPTFSAPDVVCAAHLVFELTVTDDLGATDTDRVAVIVDGAGGSTVTLPWHEDLDADPGDLVPDAGGVWSWGAFDSGPGRSWNGTNGWATNPSGNHAQGVEASLCLPAIDRGGESSVLSFRLYAHQGLNDAVRLEALHPEDGWIVLEDVDPSYDRTSPLGWSYRGVVPPFTLGTAVLPDELPDPVRVRFTLLTQNIGTNPGTYLDELRVDPESSDPDGDGLVGIRGELDQGSDPFLADTDGDGADDQAELDAGTDPRNPVELPNHPVAAAPFSWDFEDGPGDLVAVDGSEAEAEPRPTTWQHGTPVAWLGAYSGANVWATNLQGNYAGNVRSWLYLPEIDLGALVDPTLSFRLRNMNGLNEGPTLQILTDTGWQVLASDTHPYTATDALGVNAFGNVGRDDNYELVAASLADWAGERVQLRFTLHSGGIGVDLGAYIDDLAVSDETVDQDGDGLPGVLAELLTTGSDPFIADSDGDGDLDGDEVLAGTDPLNPADHSASVFLSPGDHLDFSVDDGACASGGEGWEWGAPGAGPSSGYDTGTAWGTVLSGLLPSNHRTALYLPPIDLTTAVDPVLSFRLWVENGLNDATHVEAYDPVSRTWFSIGPVQPAYQLTGPDGNLGWSRVGYRDRYDLAAFSLAGFVGEEVRLRIHTVVNGIGNGLGAYVDEIRIDEESSDPDGDGSIGVLAELADGTDPYEADSDGDGLSDGQEQADGTDPTNPADSAGALLWTVGTREPLDDDGGLGAVDDLWAYGAPAQGPLAGFTGSRVWGTGLTFDHGNNRDEAVYLPGIDLTSATRPSLAFRAWNDVHDDSFSLELYDPALGWVHASEVTPAYNNTDAQGYAGWLEPWGPERWDLYGLDLSAWTGQVVFARVVFRSDGNSMRRGVFLDDFVVEEEDLDPDGDGLFGVLDELGAHGTDPFLADTDGDGFDDGLEVGAGSDPLDPSSIP